MGRSHLLADQNAQADSPRSRILQSFERAHAHFRRKFFAFGERAFGVGSAAFHRQSDRLAG